MKKIFETIVLPVFGVIGTTISIITFIYPAFSESKISISIFTTSIFLAITIGAVMVKMILDSKAELKLRTTFNYFSVKPLQYVKSERVFLIGKESNLPLNLIVSVFSREGLYEKQVALGYVFHIQDDFVQIRRIGGNEDDKIDSLLEDPIFFSSVLVRPATFIDNFAAFIGGRP